jgi:hypothetical protein
MRRGRDGSDPAPALPKAIAVTPVAASKSRLLQMLLAEASPKNADDARAEAEAAFPRRGLDAGDDEKCEDPPSSPSSSSPSSAPPSPVEVSALWTLRALSSRACSARFRRRCGDEDDDRTEDRELRDEADEAAAPATAEALEYREEDRRRRVAALALALEE